MRDLMAWKRLEDVEFAVTRSMKAHDCGRASRLSTRAVSQKEARASRPAASTRPRASPGRVDRAGAVEERRGVRRIVQGRPHDARRRVDEDPPLDRTRVEPSRREEVCLFVPTATLHPDRMPDRLHLQEAAIPRVARRRGRPASPSEPRTRSRAARQALDVSEARLGVGPERVGRPTYRPVDVLVSGEDGMSSGFRPVSTLATPPGTSDVARTSVRVTAGNGRDSLARTTSELPPPNGGASPQTSPRSDEVRARRCRPCPLGSGIDEIEVGGWPQWFVEPSTWPILSVQPAAQTQRSMAA